MTIVKFCVLSVLPMLAGCSSLQHPQPVTPTSTSSTNFAVAPSPEQCDSYDAAHTTWGGLGAGATLLGGGAGLTAIAVDDKGARIGLAVGSAVAAAFAATSAFMANRNASRYTERCK